jgi:hypothetical protein
VRDAGREVEARCSFTHRLGILPELHYLPITYARMVLNVSIYVAFLRMFWIICVLEMPGVSAIKTILDDGRQSNILCFLSD